jgi:hypothetical protein
MDPLVEPGSTATTERLDLLVELGARAGEGMPPAAVRLLDGAGAGRPCEAAVFAAALPDPWLELRRCVTGGAGPGYWPDAAGRPLLSVEALPAGVDAGTATYRWRGRFDPDWSSVTDAALPHLLLGLVAPNDERLNGAPDPESDRRAAPSGHGRPRRSSTSPASARVAPDPLPERLAWLAVAALFLLDRLLVGRPR